MSVLFVNDRPAWVEKAYRLGSELASLSKTAADKPAPAYSMSGVLYVSHSERHGGHWGMLSVPNALVRGVFDALDEPGIELPQDNDGSLRAHVTVLRPEELELIGGPDKLTERGKRFRYRLGGLETVKPEGWSEMSRVWMLRVFSPELQQLRRSYGLSPLPNDNKFAFHVTVAVLRRGVLGRGAAAKT